MAFTGSPAERGLTEASAISPGSDQMILKAEVPLKRQGLKYLELASGQTPERCC